MNTGVYVPLQSVIFSGDKPRSRITNHMVALFLVFKRIYILFSIVAAPVYLSTSNVGGSFFSTSSLALLFVDFLMGFPGGSDGKASTCNAGDPDLIPGSGRCPGEGNCNPLQYSCLENSIDGSLVGYSSWGRKESDTTK